MSPSASSTLVDMLNHVEATLYRIADLVEEEDDVNEVWLTRARIHAEHCFTAFDMALGVPVEVPTPAAPRRLTDKELDDRIEDELEAELTGELSFKGYDEREEDDGA